MFGAEGGEAENENTGSFGASEFRPGGDEGGGDTAHSPSAPWRWARSRSGRSRIPARWPAAGWRSGTSRKSGASESRSTSRSERDPAMPLTAGAQHARVAGPRPGSVADLTGAPPISSAAFARPRGRTSLGERVDPHLRPRRLVESRPSPPVVSVVASGARRAGAVAVAVARAVRAAGVGRTTGAGASAAASDLARRRWRRRLAAAPAARRSRVPVAAPVRSRARRSGQAPRTRQARARRGPHFHHRGRRGAGRHQHRADDADQPPGDGDGATWQLRVCVPFHRLRLGRGRERDRRDRRPPVRRPALQAEAPAIDADARRLRRAQRQRRALVVTRRHPEPAASHQHHVSDRASARITTRSKSCLVQHRQPPFPFLSRPIYSQLARYAKKEIPDRVESAQLKPLVDGTETPPSGTSPVRPVKIFRTPPIHGAPRLIRGTGPVGDMTRWVAVRPLVSKSPWDRPTRSA